MIYILRGLPGAGKTRFTKTMPDVDIFSADDYHTFGGIYKFDPKRAGYAHNECFKAYLARAIQGKVGRDIIVDNTNTTLMELSPYVRVAEATARDYKIMYFLCDVPTSIERNIHGVPANTILTMSKNLLTEIVPPFWNQEVVLPTYDEDD